MGTKVVKSASNLTATFSAMFLAAVFAWAGVSKAIHAIEFNAVLARRLDISTTGSMYLVVLLLLEFALIAWIVSGKYARASFTAIMLFLIIATTVVFLNPIPEATSCGCGLPTPRVMGLAEGTIVAIRNALLAAIVIVGWSSVPAGCGRLVGSDNPA